MDNTNNVFKFTTHLASKKWDVFEDTVYTNNRYIGSKHNKTTRSYSTPKYRAKYSRKKRQK